MSEIDYVDNQITTAWAAYRTALADRLATEPDSQTVTAHHSATDERPTMRFTTTRNHRLRCEIPFDVPSARAAKALAAAGWRWRGDSFVYECARRLPDKAAAQAVWVLREVWQVPHPAFLDSACPIERTTYVIARVTSRRQLQNLAATTVAHLLDCDVDRNEHGGIELHLGTAPSALDARGGEPTLEFSTTLSWDVPDVHRANTVLNRARRYWPEIAFALEKYEATAQLHLESTVFVSRNLESALARWIDFMQEGHPQITAELAGADDAELPRALQCLLHLEDLDPAQVAKVCAHNRDDILDYIRLSAEQVIEWRQSAENSTDAEESAVCAHEADAWARTQQQLVDALRYVILDRKG